MRKLTPEEQVRRQEEKREYARKYYLAHAAQQREQARLWRLRNPDKQKDQDLRKRSKKGPYSTWSEEEKQKAREAQRRYRSRHPDKIRSQFDRRNAARKIKYATDEVFREHTKARSREVMPEVQRLRRARLKAMVFAHYGAICRCCGETEPLFLTLDHVNNDGAMHRRKISNGKARTSPTGIYFDVIRRNFPADFQVLCYNCNCGRARNGGVCPHQSARLIKETSNTDAITGLSTLSSGEAENTLQAVVGPELAV
jgi:hypothetical protein